MRAKKALAKRTPNKPAICAGPPPRPSSGKWTKRDGEQFSRWWDRRQQEDALELKLTAWSDNGFPRKGGIRSIGDLFMMTAGVSNSMPGQDMSMHTVFHAIAAELEVMAAAEMGKREERQRSNALSSHATADLYAPLLYLAQRVTALGDVIPRIIKANYEFRAESEAGK